MQCQSTRFSHYPAFNKARAFVSRKETFNKRIVEALHPQEELQTEIDNIRKVYEELGKILDPSDEHFNAHISAFRYRLRGHLLDVSNDASVRRTPHAMLLFIEGDHAYQHYKYLIELQRNPNWLNELKGITAPATSTPLANVQDPPPAYKSFADLFNNPDDVNTCVNALHRIRPDAPIISDTGHWQKCHGSKAVLSAWIQRMNDCGKIRFIADKKQLVPLLNTFFPNLNLGAEARTLKDPDANIVREFAALILP